MNRVLMAATAIEQAAFLEVEEVAEAHAIRDYRFVPDVTLEARVEKA